MQLPEGSFAAMTRTVSLFVSCFNDLLFPKTAWSAVRVLERMGLRVEFPEEQTCCGQIHLNTGYASMAVPMVRNLVRTFSEAEEVVTISGSCTALIREHYLELAIRSGDSKLVDETALLIPRVHEFSEFLTDELGITDVGAYYPHRVGYHPTCHSLRSLHRYESVIEILKAVEGLELVDLPNAEQCCGFGGTFAVKNPAMSTAILADKVVGIMSSGAEAVVSLDNSCLMHIGGALKRNNSGVSVMHLADVLAHESKGRIS